MNSSGKPSSSPAAASAQQYFAVPALSAVPRRQPRAAIKARDGRLIVYKQRENSDRYEVFDRAIHSAFRAIR